MFYFRMTSLSIRNITRVGTRNLFLQLLNLDLNEDVSYLTTTEKLSYKKLHKEFTCKLQLTSKAQYPSTLIFLFPFFYFFLFPFLATAAKELVKLLINIDLFMQIPLSSQWDIHHRTTSHIYTQRA